MLVISTLISLACAIHAVRRRGPIWKRAMWTLVVFLPLLGPLLYGGLYERLLPHGDDMPSRPEIIGHNLP